MEGAASRAEPPSGGGARRRELVDGHAERGRQTPGEFEKVGRASPASIFAMVSGVRAGVLRQLRRDCR